MEVGEVTTQRRWTFPPQAEKSRVFCVGSKQSVNPQHNGNYLSPMARVDVPGLNTIS